MLETQAAYDRRMAYFRRIAADVGIAPADLDDAGQEMMIRWWQSGYHEGSGIARRFAVDAVRRYGPRTRHGGVRAVCRPLGTAQGRGVLDLYEGLARLDIRRAARGLTQKQRTALRRWMAGLQMSNLDSVHVSTARRKLRAALAA